jgi:hypothetical protein
MTPTGDRGPSLLSVYAAGIKKWVKSNSFIRTNLLLVVLGAVFLVCVLLLAALDQFSEPSDGLVYRVGAEVVTAVLVATTVGLFYELVARKGMTRETVDVVKQQLAGELAAFHDGQMGAAAGLIGYGTARQYVHQDLTNHLSSVGNVRAMVIHGTRIWSNRDLERAITDNPSVTLRALLLAPSSPFVQSRADEYPDAYDREVMRGQIASAAGLLHKWHERNGSRCQLKLYDYPPSFWLLFIDDVLYLSEYERGKVSQDSAVFKFDDRPHSLYHMFNEYFERAWLHAVGPASGAQEGLPARALEKDADGASSTPPTLGRLDDRVAPDS